MGEVTQCKPSTLSGLFQRLIRSDSPESPKALVLYQSASGLLVIALTLTATSAITIWETHDLGSGAVTALLGSLGFLAGLAGFHRQADPIPPVESIPGASRSVSPSVDCADPGQAQGGQS